MDCFMLGTTRNLSPLMMRAAALLAMIVVVLASEKKDVKLSRRSAFWPQWQQYQYRPPPPAQPHYSPYQYPKPVYNVPPRIPPQVTSASSSLLSGNNVQDYAATKTIEPNNRLITNFERMALEYHNQHRRMHKVPTLILDHTMSTQAAQYAKEIVRSGVIRHAPTQTRPNKGENIAIGCRLSPKGMTAFEAVHDWYSTVCHYNFESAGYYEKARPFTKIVWSPYSRFGIGKADFDKGQFRCSVVVARYGDFDNANPPSPLDFSRYVKRGRFHPTHCQYLTNKDQLDYIQPPQNPSLPCEKVKGHSGAFLHENNVCTLEKLFTFSGLSVRKGKLAFKLLL